MLKENSKAVQTVCAPVILRHTLNRIGSDYECNFYKSNRISDHPRQCLRSQILFVLYDHVIGDKKRSFDINQFVNRCYYNVSAHCIIEK